MKKIIIVVIILLLACAIVLIKYLSRPSSFEIASKAELHGKYSVAMEHYIKAVLEVTEALPYPDKSKAVTITDDEWMGEVQKYFSWVTFSVPDNREEFNKAADGIKRCTLYVENENFITEKEPKELVKDSLMKEWIEPFVRKMGSNSEAHEKLISRALKDSVSILRIRAMTGYIYTVRLLDLKTGKRVDFMLYPNTSISLLVKPREYFLICSSEVQFTEGLSGKTWYSSENIIPFVGLDRTCLKQITLKTRVHRKK